ncbi:MAG TPA: glycoside hydrolase family 127 protein [Candidatus Limnocylindrales bacterium]|nr:glycoside hydrolase family 127 protein [Candidatus Limnocylindrales bacterium]
MRPSRRWCKQKAWHRAVWLSFLTLATPIRAEPQRDYPIKPVPFTAVHLQDLFWASRIETNRAVTIPFAFEQCEKSGRMDNFDRAAKALRGESLENRKAPPYPFDDTDPYKVLEGASYALAVQPDPKLQGYLDDLIAKIGGAQEHDGYLYTARTINPAHPHDWSGPERWLKDPDESHELYNAGHLFEAAAAHFQATGETNLLNIAIKEANLLCATFGPDKLQIWPGHEIVEMGLAKLYRVTGDRRYLELAKFFIDVRGPGGDDYHQSKIKPVDQTEAIGHAVRAGYLYSGMADVAALTGDERYVQAIDTIWENVVGKKLYLTGGIGALGAGEAFGANYQLPNLSAYCETCAAVANAYWNFRLFLLHGDAKYVDVMERTLYNGVLSGVSLDGKRFFYPNPLESDGRHQRSPWFGVACCPGNITRFLASVPGYVYEQKGDALFVNLYSAGQAEITLENGTKLKIVQQTRYPWDGSVRLKLEPQTKRAFTVNLRIPGWARNEVVPSDLYTFQSPCAENATIKVNGKLQSFKIEKGYAALTRKWNNKDIVELNLPMPVRRVVANSKVEDDTGKVALQRGPLVYCVEWPDVKDGHVVNLLLPDNGTLTSDFRPDLLGGLEVVRGTAQGLAYSDARKSVREQKVAFVAIPYYAWANRGRGEMSVWLARTESAARPLPFPTVASTSKATASAQGVRPDVNALNDQREPKSSGDHANRFLHWWPHKGTKEWVQYDFAKQARVGAVEIYWFDDTGVGECRLPKAWQLFYRDNGEWRLVSGASGYGCDGDKYNRTTFDPVQTDGLRLEVQLPDHFSSGIHEWRVEEAQK